MPLKNLEKVNERARAHLDDYVAGLDTELGPNLKAVWESESSRRSC